MNILDSYAYKPFYGLGMTPAPRLKHQVISLKLASKLDSLLKNKYLVVEAPSIDPKNRNEKRPDIVIYKLAEFIDDSIPFIIIELTDTTVLLSLIKL